MVIANVVLHVGGTHNLKMVADTWSIVLPQLDDGTTDPHLQKNVDMKALAFFPRSDVLLLLR